jgi:dGTP triphosphohydrolase
MSDKTDVKIQLNSLEALERLIGGDSALEVEIRNSVVQNFATKHLKSLANTSNQITQTLSQIKAEIEKKITEELSASICEFKKTYWNHIEITKLKPEVELKIQEAVQRLFGLTVKQIITYAIEKYLDEKYLEQEINRLFEYYTKAIIDKKVREKIEELKKNL